MQLALLYTAFKRYFFFGLVLVSYYSGAQINFEKGYFVGEDNTKTECLIKNQDWDENPSQFKFKLKENESVQTGSISNIQEFGVYGSFKYVRADIKIDKSPSELADLTHTKDPIWSQEKLFLKVLISGKANLYAYSGAKNSEKFFYSVSDKSIQQLVYKQYVVSKPNELYETNTQIMNNFAFRQQLWVDVRCSQTPKSTLETINYTKKELLNYFKKYNECVGDSFIEYGAKTNKSREFFNLSITPGINSASATFEGSHPQYTYEYDFRKQRNIRIGLEAEFILPFNNNKWGIFLEPYYKSYNDAKVITGTDSVTINYKAIELNVGLRYYIFLNKNAKFFINVNVNSGMGLNKNSTIVYDYYYQPFIITASFNYALGAGVAYKRFSGEFRYYTKQNLLSNYTNYSSNYNSVSIIFGFKFIKVKGKS